MQFFICCLLCVNMPQKLGLGDPAPNRNEPQASTIDSQNQQSSNLPPGFEPNSNPWPNTPETKPKCDKQNSPLRIRCSEDQNGWPCSDEMRRVICDDDGDTNGGISDVQNEEESFIEEEEDVIFPIGDEQECSKSDMICMDETRCKIDLRSHIRNGNPDSVGGL